MLTEIYQWLAAAGYEHPIHPAITHLPIGTVFAAWAFTTAGIITRRREMQQAGYYCTVLALIVLMPTMFLGLVDWAHYYADALIAPIRYKIILACVLAIGLLAVVLGHRWINNARRLAVFVSLLLSVNMAIVVVIGFFGGNLVYGGKQPLSPPSYQAGASLFEANCMGCHVRGGNILDPNLPLLGAPQLASETTFIDFLRKPHMPDSAAGAMPGFDVGRLSDENAAALYEYVTVVLQDPRSVSKQSDSP
jgi:uncharacterized membrane protein